MQDNRSLTAATTGRASAPRSARSIHTPKSRKREQRGAAFLIAIAILVILVAIGTTFFSVSRLELKTATNVGATVRVDLLNDAAHAIAIHHLNQYFLREPDVTAQDHSFKSLFSGAFAAGKSWLRRKEPTAFDPNPIVGKSMLQGGLPLVDINRIQSSIDQAAANITGATGPVVLYWPEDGHKEQLFRGPRSNNWLYIPRFQTAFPNDNPFAPAVPDYILLYDYDGDVSEIRANAPDDAANRAIELRIEDGANSGLGTLVAASPADLDSLNGALASLGPVAQDVRLFYFSDIDPNDTADAVERQARYSFVTAAIYRENGTDDNTIDNSLDTSDYGINDGAAFDINAAGYPEETLGKIGDIDNDGDGYPDSIWMPIPEDVFLANDQIDNNLNGLIDETQDNGIDDDGDTLIDYALPRKPDGSPQEAPDGVIPHDEDEAIEAGALVYNGLGPYVELDTGLARVGDGLDNDGDNAVDEADEDRYFLTCPLPGVRVPLDLDGDGAASTIENYRPYDPVNNTFPSLPYQVLNPALVIAPSVQVRVINPATQAPEVITLSNLDVDAIDNDYDLLLNDYYAFGYIGPWQPTGWQPVGNWAPGESATFANQIKKSYNDLNRAVWNSPGSYLVGTAVNSASAPPKPGGGYEDIEWDFALRNDINITNLLNYVIESLRITHSGEPVCNLVGRAAIQINDEASKINLNVAGAETFNPFPVPAPNEQGLMIPAFGSGATPYEYDLGTLPRLGSYLTESQASIVSKIAGFLTGGPAGKHLARETNQIPNESIPFAQQLNDPVNALTGQVGSEAYDYAYDASLPGAGRVDDNGNAIIASLDGIDNNGDGLTDEGFISPASLPAAYDEVLKFRDGDITRMELIRDPDDGFNDERFTQADQLNFVARWFRIGSFEGIDEPAERQLFNPLRNELAESDQTDNDVLANLSDAPAFVDENGELGDRVFQSESELRNIDGLEATVDRLDRLTTLYSTDRNVSFIPTEVGVRALNKTDLNRASAKQLGAKLLLANDVTSPLQLIDKLAPFEALDNSGLQQANASYPGYTDAYRFADGLRQADTRVFAHDPTAGNDGDDPNNPVRGGFLFDRQNAGTISLSGAGELPLDQQLEFLQLAVNIADARDTGHARSELTTERTDLVQKTAADLGLAALYPDPFPSFAELNTNNVLVQNWPTDPTAQQDIEEENLFPLEEIQNHLEDVMNLSPGQRRLQITDQWWTDRVRSNTFYPNTSTDPDDLLPEQRHISYTAAGVESIRINELMVRPVRRVEAEAFPDQNVDVSEDPIIGPVPVASRANLDPTPFAESQISNLSADVNEDLPNLYPHPTGGGVNKDYLLAASDSLMPEFAVVRRVLNADFTGGDPGLSQNIQPVISIDPLTAPLDSDWRLSSNAGGVLGDRSALTTTGFANLVTREYDPAGVGPLEQFDFLVPDVMEVTFSEANARIVGLPNGRYYLALKLEDGDDDLRQVISDGRLSYTIKYHQLGLAGNITNGVMEEIETLLSRIDDTDDDALQGQRYREYVDYFTNNFKQVPATHLANGPGEPEGWVFLDATPKEIAANAYNPDPGHFGDFPPAYSMVFVIAPGVELDMRVSVEYLPDPINAPGSPWYLRVTSDALSGILVPVTAQIDGPGVTETQTINPTTSSAQPIFDFADRINNAQLAALMGGQFTLNVTPVPGVAQTVQQIAAPAIVADFKTTHTVTIPPLDSDFVVSVALTTSPMPNPAYTEATLVEAQQPGGSIGVNFFDFSQEPDHEYIEIANTSNDAVDLTGWLLEVGPQKKEGMPYTPFTTQWKVPGGTVISPGGMLLLTFNKFDRFDTPPSEGEDNLINHNGIGMASADLVSLDDSSTPEDIHRVTVPPIADNSRDDLLYNPLANSLWYDPTGSVFARANDPDTAKNEFSDYVDDYGAGVTTNYFGANNVPLYLDPEQPGKGIVPDELRASVEAGITSSKLNPSPSYPWDRIIELQNVRLWQNDANLLQPTTTGNVSTMADITNVDALARFVLRGGVLPNYPERDGIDNDGDGAYINDAAIYMAGILDTDMVDNDLDGLVDESGRSLDIDGDSVADLVSDFPETPGLIDSYAWPFTSEGVDEGRLGLRRATVVPGNTAPYHAYGAGSFEFGTLPTLIHPVRRVRDNALDPFNTALGIGNDVLSDGEPFPGGVLVQDNAGMIDLVPNDFGAGSVWSTFAPFVTIAGGDLVISALPASNTVAVLDDADTAVQGKLRASNRRGYLVSFSIDAGTSTTTGAIQLEFGDWTSEPLFVNTAPSTMTEFVPALPASEFVTQNTLRVVATVQTTPIDVIVSDITVIPVDTANTPGTSGATGLAMSDKATFGTLDSLFVAGNQNQVYATELGQLYQTEPALGLPVGEDALYLGSDLDPPDWKAFAERRMYPGDNVIVSLYDAAGDVADRVTYREYDVINRTIDDVVGSPYEVTGYHDMLASEGVQNANATVDYVSLHPDYPTFWLPNHMGLDFYRSLERKHTLATGDRFGTQNRWQATDGNYDDWADSLSVFARGSELGVDAYRAEPSLRDVQAAYSGGSPDPVDFLLLSRFYSGWAGGGLFRPGFPSVEDKLRLYGHAIWGTPLRMNTAMRKVANPVDPLRVFDPTMTLANNNGLSGEFGMGPDGLTSTQLISQFMTPPDPGTRVARGAGTFDDVPNNLWQQRQSDQKVQNSPFSAPIDLGGVPHLTYEHGMINVARANDGTQGPVYSYLHDPLRLNFLTSAPEYFNDISQRSTLVSHSEALTDGSERPLTALLNSGATDSITLSVAQANFLPIEPNISTMNTDDLPAGSIFQDLLLWQYPNGTPDEASAEAPAAWSPVFLFGEEDEVLTPEVFSPNGTVDYRKLPFYAKYPQDGGFNNLKVDPTAFLFESSFLSAPDDWQRAFYPFFASAPSFAPDIASAAQQVQRRWPLDKRVVMYVAKPRNKAPGIPMSDVYRPEALWVWDAEDGLENGEYEVYIGTWLPGLAQSVKNLDDTINAIAAQEPELVEDLVAPATVNATTTISNGIVTQFATDQIGKRDPELYDPTVSGSPFSAEYEIDILTDPTKTLGVKTNTTDTSGLMPSVQWQPSVTYRANAAGYIFYGTDAATGWQPLLVRVTDNFLALRVRHAGTTYQTGAISHVVLSPRKRTPGRLNVNTTQFKLAQSQIDTGALAGENTLALTHPLAGLPGILDLGGEFGPSAEPGSRLAVTDPAQVPFTAGSSVLPEPYEMLLDDSGTLKLGNITNPALGDIYDSMPPAANPNGLLRFLYDPDAQELSGAVGALSSVFDGVDLNDEGEFLPALYKAVKAGRYLTLAMMQLGRTEYQDGRYYKSVGDLVSEDADFIGGPDGRRLYPLSNNSDAELRRQEVESRLRRMANAISVRSDVFEIITTVQSGYGVDADGNGYYDYRDSREFITTSETRSRMVYERRAPSDNSDETDVSTQ